MKHGEINEISKIFFKTEIWAPVLHIICGFGLFGFVVVDFWEVLEGFYYFYY